MYTITWVTSRGGHSRHTTDSLEVVAANLVLRYKARQTAVAKDDKGIVIGRAWKDGRAWNWYLDQSYTLTDIPPVDCPASTAWRD